MESEQLDPRIGTPLTATDHNLVLTSTYACVASAVARFIAENEPGLGWFDFVGTDRRYDCRVPPGVLQQHTSDSSLLPFRAMTPQTPS